MSEHLNQKDYGDYFKSLEKRISGDTAKPVQVSQATGSKNKTGAKKRKSLRYSVFRIRPIAFFGIALILIITLLAVSLANCGGDKKKKDTPATSSIAATKPKEEKKEPLIIYSEDAKTAAIPAENDAASAIIVDTETHKIVASRNHNERLHPASLTKIMTLLVAAENTSDYNDTFTMTYAITDPLYIAEASVAGFLNDETVTVKDMLYGLILPSGADAAMGLAMKIAGSEKDFVALMNEKAEELGLKDTHFMNVSGLYDPKHYTTAYDMAIILEATIKNPFCKEILSTYQYTTSKTPQNPNGIPLSATLFDYMYGTEPETATIQGGKTGYVNEAGYCIASFGSNNTTKTEYITVTLKNSSIWPAFHGQIALYKQFAK